MYEDVVNGILSVIPDKVERIILYGSVARGDDTPESDIDIALITRESLNRDEFARISNSNMKLGWKYEKYISVANILEKRFLAWQNTSPFYKNIAKEGIVLWKKAG